MKNIVILFMLISTNACAQIEVGGSFGRVKLRKLSNDITVLSSSESSLYFGTNFNFGEFSFSPQIELTASNIICDGIFYSGTPNRFSVTPINSKQSKFSLTTLRIPLYFRALLEGYKENGRYSTIKFGPTFNYVLATKQQYKIDNKVIKEKAPLDNKVNVGLALEYNIYKSIAKGKLIMFGYGINYALTDFLKENKSFKPMSYFLRFGVSFLKSNKANNVLK